MTAPPPANRDQAVYWNEHAAPGWIAQQAALDTQIGPLGEVALRALAPAAGERVLDIGCGCGDSTLSLAHSVGPDGAVLGVDLSAPMLAVAQRRAAALPQASFRQADAQSAPLAPPGTAPFDAAFSRFGVMFFADPASAFANIGGALRPGGRLAFVCWRTLADNPWMTLPLQAALPVLPPEPASPEDPLAPGPMALADPARTTALLRQAGFTAITLTPHDARIGGLGLEAALELALMVGPLGRRLREAPQHRAQAAAALRPLLQAHLEPDGVRMPAGVWIVTARWQKQARDSSDPPG